MRIINKLKCLLGFHDYYFAKPLDIDFDKHSKNTWVYSEREVVCSRCPAKSKKGIYSI
jgi:hypothetical protein